MKKIMRKTAILLYILLIISSTTTSYTMEATTFTDIQTNDWFYDAVTKMSESGIIKGYPDGTFKPQNPVTYGEFIKLMVVATTGEDIGNSDTGHWAKNYYGKAIECGLFTEADIFDYQLSEGIPRKSMAFLISNNFKGIKVENYNLIQNSIIDLDNGKPYQHQIIKAYGLGILTGYPDGEYKPDNTLTRAESTTVINRILNENERKIPQFQPVISNDSYWKNDPNYNEMVEWYEYGRENKRYVLGANFKIEEGKIVIINNDNNSYTEWSPDTTNYPKMNEHIYTVLKAYYEYAKDRDMGISIGCMKAHDKISIGLTEYKGDTDTLFYFAFAGDPIVYEDEPNFVKPYVMYNQGTYATVKDWERLGTEELLKRQRIGDESLIELNRDIFKTIYGNDTGNKIMDYAIQQYKDSFNEETLESIDLPNNKILIDGINIFYYDNASGIEALYMDQPK